MNESYEERAAMRAYLARAEVRLSTLHRIATAFIGGSGLLILFPVFFKDVIINIIEIMLAHTDNHFASLDNAGWALTALLFMSIGYSLICSLSIPLYGVYLLLKDIVHFYFTLYAPGFTTDNLTPTFALTGLLYSPDESTTDKANILRYQYKADHVNYVLPFSDKRRELYLQTLIKNTPGYILPDWRTEHMPKDVLESADPKTIQYVNAAFGITRSIERTLNQEVAVAEMAIIRHSLYLRRLVLRYVKTLLMFIWTTMLAFLMLPFLLDDRMPTLFILALGYAVWAIWARRIMRMPIRWIYRHRYDSIPWDHVDPQLTMMEDYVRPYLLMAVASSLVGLILASIGLFV